VKSPAHIGIVAVSAEGAALCYRTLCAEGAELLGPHMHPEVSMHTIPLGRYMGPLQQRDWAQVAGLLQESACKLEAAGAEFLICPDNTVHEALDICPPESTLPWLHIAAVVAEEALARGYTKLGILGTDWLMDSLVYPRQCSALGLLTTIPEASQRSQINGIIFDELVNMVVTSHSRSYFSAVIKSLAESGCDAVVLGCTEIPLLIEQADSCLPILDSTRLLARAALRRALAGR
jgi:aspartate racemase